MFSNTILICSTKNSESEWIMKALNYRNFYQKINNAITESISMKLVDWKKLLPGDVDIKWKRFVADILNGNIPDDLILAKMRSYMDIRGNKLLLNENSVHFQLRWINTQFPKIKSIILLRHPCSVSKLCDIQKDIVSLDKLKKIGVSEFFSDKELMLSDNFSKLLIKWCLENRFALKNKSEECLVLFHEELCMDPITHFGHLFSYAGEEFNHNVYPYINHTAISRANPDSGIAYITEWLDYVSDDELKSAEVILKKFGFDKIYKANDPEPISSNLEEFCLES